MATFLVNTREVAKAQKNRAAGLVTTISSPPEKYAAELTWDLLAGA